MGSLGFGCAKTATRVHERLLEALERNKKSLSFLPVVRVGFRVISKKQFALGAVSNQRF